MSENIWNDVNGVREGENNSIQEDFDLLLMAKEYVNAIVKDENTESKGETKEKFLKALEKSSGLSKAYVLDYIMNSFKGKELPEELKTIVEKIKNNEKTSLEVYDSLLGDFVSETGKSKKNSL